MATKIQFRRDLAANWTAANPTLSQGELGLELDTCRVKIGDGSTNWNSLDYKFEGAPRVYFQASQTVAQTAIGVSPVTMTALENQNSDTGVFSYAAGELTINKTGTFRFVATVTGDTNTGSRETLHGQLERNGAAIPLADGNSEAFSYHRNNASGESTMVINTILNVTSGDVYRLRLDSPTSTVNTIPAGTSLIVEEL